MSTMWPFIDCLTWCLFQLVTAPTLTGYSTWFGWTTNTFAQVNLLIECIRDNSKFRFFLIAGAGDNKLALWKIEANEHLNPKSKVLSSSKNLPTATTSSNSLFDASSTSTSASNLSRRPHRACKRVLPQSASATAFETIYSLNNFGGSYSASLPNSFSSNSTSTNYFRPNRFRQSHSFGSRMSPSYSSTFDNNNNTYFRNRASEDAAMTRSRSSSFFENPEYFELNNVNFGVSYEEPPASANNEQEEVEELSWTNNVVASDIDEEEDDCSDSNNNFSNEASEEDDEDEEEEQEEDEANISFKRRRLNTIGKFDTPKDGIQYNKPVKTIKCMQSKRIRALTFNPKRDEIAAISMNSTFHYFDIKRFEQVWLIVLSVFI